MIYSCIVLGANCKLGQPIPANCPNQPIKASNLTTANSLIYQNTRRQLDPSAHYRGEPHLLVASCAQLMGCPWQGSWRSPGGIKRSIRSTKVHGFFDSAWRNFSTGDIDFPSRRSWVVTSANGPRGETFSPRDRRRWNTLIYYTFTVISSVMYIHEADGPFAMYICTCIPWAHHFSTRADRSPR